MKINGREQNHPSTTLGFLDLDVAKATVLASLRSPGSRRCYQHAIVGFIAWYCSEPRLGFTKVRHTFASRLRETGTSLANIAELLGHRQLEMTRRYAHISISNLHTAVGRIDKHEKATDTSTDTGNAETFASVQ